MKLKSVFVGVLTLFLLVPLGRATVTFVGNDWDTDAGWRTPTIVKPNDIDHDNIYGTAGYYLPAGLRAGYKGTLLSDNIINGPSNPDDIDAMPSWITSFEFADPNERGASWGGQGGNFGFLDNVGGGHTGFTGAALLRQDRSAEPLVLVLKRQDSPAFRLTLILGNNPDEGPFADPLGQEVTVDDGTGPVTQVTGDTVFHSRTTYQSWDISAGSSDIIITLKGLPEGFGQARLSGLAFDIETVVPPSILEEPEGGVFLAGIDLTLSVVAGGSQPLSYEWYKDGLPIAGATDPILGLPALGLSDAGEYLVVVSNAGGSVTSAPVNVQVETALPNAVVAYQDALANELFLIAEYPFNTLDAMDAFGFYPGTLEGRVKFTTGPGGGADKALKLDGSGHVRLGAVADFEFLFDRGAVEAWVQAGWDPAAPPRYSPTLFANRDGAVTRWSIHMTPDKSQIIFWNGAQAGVATIPNAGMDWHHVVCVFEDGSWHLFWDGALVDTQAVPLGGTTGLPTQIGSSSDQTTTEGWIGALDEVAFYADVLSLAEVQNHVRPFLSGVPPALIEEPVGGTFLAGIAYSLRVGAVGADLSFQWYKDDAPLADATNTVLSFPALQETDAGQYYAVVSNPAGSVTSQVAVLQVEASLSDKLIAYQDAVRNELFLLAEYPFDDLTANDVLGLYPGRLAGSAAFGEGVSGGADKALALDGAGYVRLGQVEPFEFNSDRGAVEAWIRADWDPADPPPYNPTIFANRDGVPTRWSIHMMQNKEQIAYWNGSQVALISVPPAGTDWHHIVCVFDSGVWRLYWDGQLAGTANIPFGANPGLPTEIGSARDTQVQEGWVGAIDEVAFYSDILTLEQVQDHVRAFLVGAPPEIAEHPAGGVFLAGSPLELSVFALGVDLTYQWYKDGQALTGATNTTLSFVGLTAGDTGDYVVVVSNAAGSVTSDVARVVVAVPDVATYQATVQSEPSLISLYTFDNADANDAMGLHHGTVVAAAFDLGVGGGPDQALSLAAAGQVNLDFVPDFEFLDDTGTVETWLRADWEPGTAGYNPAIFAARNGGPTRWSIHMANNKNQIALWNGSRVVWANIPPAGTVWHHLACVFDNGTFRVYWDGQLAGEFGIGLGSTTGLPTQIGSSSAGSTTEGWIGALDEVAFYSDALSAAAIRAHHAAMVLGPTLSFSRSGSTMTISWPAGLTGFILESTDQLPATTWEPVPDVVGNQATVDISTGTKFFRLRRP